MSRFPYSDPIQAQAFAMGYFQRLKADPDIRQTWLGLQALIQVRIHEPNIAVHVDTRDGATMTIVPGVTAEKPNLTLTLSADVFHQIYAGEMNVFMAFARRKIKTQGNAALIMKTTWTLPQAIRIYRAYGAESGAPGYDLTPWPPSLRGKEEAPLPAPGRGRGRGELAEGGTRVDRLKARFLQQPREVCIERARYWTQSYRQTEGAPAAMRQAQALAHVLDHLTVHIEPEELVVGALTGKVLGGVVYPEGVGRRIGGELATLRARATNPFSISDDETRELLDDILPTWQGRTLEDRARAIWPPAVANAIDQVAPFIITEIAGIGHVLLNFEKLFRVGLEGVIAEAEGCLAALKESAESLTGWDCPNEFGTPSRAFYEAVVIAGRAAIRFAHRYADEADRLAAIEPDPGRRAELAVIAQACRRVPARPPRTFHEALQAIQFLVIIEQNEEYGSAVSIGRLDVLLQPFYAADVAAGRLTREQAQELLGCLFVKLSHSIPLFDADVTLAFSGLTTFVNAIVGGVDTAGQDVTNDVTYLALETMAALNTPNPTFGVRLHEGTPLALTRAVTEAVAGGLRNVQFFNDAAVIPSLTNRGVPLAEARQYAIIGCVEPAAPGASFTSSDAALFNLPLCLELALNDGRGRVFTERIGVSTGDPRAFRAIDDVVDAYRQQVEHLVGLMVAALDVLGVVHREHKPTPFLSSFTDDCLAKGLDVTAGGARYNFTGVQGVGAATVGDSLAAIQRLIFEEKRLNWDELLAALDADFEGCEPMRQLLLNHAPKYGNDDEAADHFARLAAEVYCQTVERHPNPRGGWYSPGLYSVTTHVALGLTVGATPDGRRASEPLSQGGSPAQGRDRQGPTAALRSAARLNYGLVSNGAVLNQRLHPMSLPPLSSPPLGGTKGRAISPPLGGTKGGAVLAGLLRGFFDLGGMHLQWNIVDRDTLRAAQAHPEQYRDLVVRVSGYSALFTDLDPIVQDEIISRTEHVGDW